MNLELVPLLRCPGCSHWQLIPHEFESTEDGRCQRGALICERCRVWYPISGAILNLLPAGREQPGSRDEFYGENRVEMEALGAGPPPGRPDRVDPDFSTQANQRAHFDDLATRHDQLSYQALGEMPFHRALRELTFGAWGPLIGRGSVVLDVGCGDGLSTFYLTGPGIEVLAFDISRESLGVAEARARSLGLGNVSFLVADADAIPVADRSADCVLCYGALHHVPDPARTLGEADRVLKHGGVYLGVENNKTPLRPLFDLLMRLRPIWKEEAGAEAQIGGRELKRWTVGLDLHLETQPIVFVPPHLCNRLSVPAAKRLLRFTDALFGRLPLLRDWGGLLAIFGRKLPRASE